MNQVLYVIPNPQFHKFKVVCSFEGIELESAIIEVDQVSAKERA